MQSPPTPRRATYRAAFLATLRATDRATVGATNRATFATTESVYDRATAVTRNTTRALVHRAVKEGLK